MRCLEKFNRKMSLSGGSLRNEKIRNSQLLLEEVFADDPSFTPGVYFWELGRWDFDGQPDVPIRIYKRTYSSAQGNTRKFQTMIDTPVVVGDVLYDSDEDVYMICTESFKIDGIHWQGKLTLCNWILKWQNKNGDILEYPCHDINSTQYNSGEQSNRQFTIGSSQHMITLPYDENTVILSNPQRFFLDRNTVNPTSYIVTQNDTTSYNYGTKGIVRVTVLECANNHETDRIDLGICDYIDKKELETDNADGKFIAKSVISYDTNIVKSGGDIQEFIGRFFDSYGNEVEIVNPVWKIICDFEDALQIERIGNKLRLGIDNDDYVDEDLKIVFSDDKGLFSSSLIIRIGSLL